MSCSSLKIPFQSGSVASNQRSKPCADVSLWRTVRISKQMPAWESQIEFISRESESIPLPASHCRRDGRSGESVHRFENLVILVCPDRSYAGTGYHDRDEKKDQGGYGNVSYSSGRMLCPPSGDHAATFTHKKGRD